EQAIDYKDSAIRIKICKAMLWAWEHKNIIIAVILGIIILLTVIFGVIVPNIKNHKETVKSSSATVEKAESQEVTNVTTDTAVTTIKSETTVVTESDSTETAQMEDLIPEGALYRLVDIGSLYDTIRINDNLICSPKYIQNDEYWVSQINLDFIDINENKILGTVSLPTDFNISKIYALEGNALVKIVSENYDYESDSYIIYVATVYDDFKLEIVEDPLIKDLCFERYGHKIVEWDNDVLCADNVLDIIVPGYSDVNDVYGKNTKWQTYMFPIDKNRFVYRTNGYERIPGFGIYDFSTNVAKDVPNSDDLIPLEGVHNGKIYSVKSSWDGFGSEIYVTDINTLETKFFTDFPFSSSDSEHFAYVKYYMSKKGDYILAVKDGYEVDRAICLIDTDSAEIISTYDVPDELSFGGTGFFIDDTNVALAGYSNNNSKLIIFDLQSLLSADITDFTFTSTDNFEVTSTSSEENFYDVYDYGYVNVGSDTLNVRSGPSKNNDKVGTLADGATVYIWFYEDGWYYIYYENDGYDLYGYVSSEFVELY
ncbi:MAG: SH3 domain-containing protein, partial [Muribaculaceae bacterium]|nr:SH3 domain-containing protein [Muribaculaceae bacterium]